MNEPYQSDVVFLLGYGLAVVIIPVVTLLAFKLVRPSRRESVKAEPYESGMPQASAPRRPFHMAYYNFALVFIVFEVETLLLFAVAGVLTEYGWLAVAEVAGFVVLVAAGLFYAWRKGVLVWR